MYFFQISRPDRSADIQSEREAQLRTSWLPSAARIYARLLRAPQLDSAIKDLHAQEMSRAATYGLRWRVLSDAGGFAVALLIAADCGLARAGVIADTTQMLGLASHCRVHAAVQTLTHLGGVTACEDPRDARTRLLAPDGWLPDFLNDWLRGQLGALSKCTSITANHHNARVALGEALRAAPATFLSLGPLDWLVHAVGGEAWLLSVLTETENTPPVGSCRHRHSNCWRDKPTSHARTMQPSGRRQNIGASSSAVPTHPNYVSPARSICRAECTSHGGLR